MSFINTNKLEMSVFIYRCVKDSVIDNGAPKCNEKIAFISAP